MSKEFRMGGRCQKHPLNIIPCDTCAAEMTTTNEHTERAEFEKYFVRSNRRGTKHAANALAKNEHGDYIYDSTQRHWWTWQNATKAAAMLEAQPAREWVGLTEEEIAKAWVSVPDPMALKFKNKQHVIDFASAIEAKLREKNAGQPAADDKAGGEPVASIYMALYGNSVGVEFGHSAKHHRLDDRWLCVKFNSQEHAMAARDALKRLSELARPIISPDEFTHPKPQAEVRVPDGWKLVPVEPTDDMLRAIRNQRSGGRIGKGDRADWAAWLAAAPKPQDDLPAILKKQAS